MSDPIANGTDTNKVRNLVTFGYATFLIGILLIYIRQIVDLFLSGDFGLMHMGSKVGVYDFVEFYISGAISLSSFRSELFNPETTRKFFEAITHYSTDAHDMRVFYLPFFPLLMAPFTYLPLASAKLAFILISTFIGIWGLYELSKNQLWCGKLNLIFILGIAASEPSMRNWWHGQVMWLYVGLMAFFLLFFFKKKDFVGGFFLSLLSLKPQYALFAALPAIVGKRYRLLLAAAITELLLLTACLTYFGHHALKTYMDDFNSHEITAGITKASAMNCVRGILSIFFSAPQAYKISCYINLVCLAMSLGITYFVLSKKQNRQILSWLYSTLILISLLFSPHAHFHDCLLIAIPAILTLPLLANESNLSPASFIWKWSLYLFPVITPLCSIVLSRWIPTNWLITAIITLLLVCAAKVLFEHYRLATNDKA